MRYNLVEIVTNDQPVALQMAKGTSQHPLRDPVHAPADLRMAELAIYTERVNDSERPAVAGMGQHLTADPVVIDPETVADGLGILEDVLSA